MKFKNKYSRNGYIFGNVCKFFGTLFTVILLPLVPNEFTYINKGFVIPAIISFIISVYGFWRTGGVKYET